jgi:hypothetical protein
MLRHSDLASARLGALIRAFRGADEISCARRQGHTNGGDVDRAARPSSRPRTAQITVKHVTVNADQAVVTDQLVTDKSESNSPALLTIVTEKPIQMVAESIEPELAGVGRENE